MNISKHLYQLLHRDTPDVPKTTPIPQTEPSQDAAVATDPAPMHPSATLPCEDPSPTEALRTPNSDAYEADLRSFR